MFESAGGMYHIQNKLSETQAFPVIGPFLMSPVKAFVSVVETVVGLAIAILFGLTCPFFLLFENEPYYKWTVQVAYDGLINVALGVFSLGYSLGNFVSFGSLGYHFELEHLTRQSINS